MVRHTTLFVPVTFPVEVPSSLSETRRSLRVHVPSTESVSDLESRRPSFHESYCPRKPVFGGRSGLPPPFEVTETDVGPFSESWFVWSINTVVVGTSRRRNLLYPVVDVPSLLSPVSCIPPLYPLFFPPPYSLFGRKTFS